MIESDNGGTFIWIVVSTYMLNSKGLASILAGTFLFAFTVSGKVEQCGFIKLFSRFALSKHCNFVALQRAI